jgi:hypothetical protein
MAVDSRNFLMNTDYPIDKISSYYEGSTTVASLDSETPTIPHGLAYTPLYFVRWSTSPDFVVSYDELGVSTINDLILTAQTDSTNLYLFILNNTGSPVTFYYRVIYFMPTNVDLDAAETQSDLDNFALNTDYNYTKILLEDFVSSATATIDHDLGYYPQVEAWFIRSADGRCVHHVANSVAASSPEGPRARVTTTQVILEDGSLFPASGWHYKIYADEI